MTFIYLLGDPFSSTWEAIMECLMFLSNYQDSWHRRASTVDSQCSQPQSMCKWIGNMWNVSTTLSISYSLVYTQILDDIKESMHYKDEHHTVYFQKLELANIDEVFNLLEFSREQIINNVTQVQKELLRSL